MVEAATPAPALKKPQQFVETVADLLAAGLLHPGEELRSLRKAASGRSVVVQPTDASQSTAKTTVAVGLAMAVSGKKAEPGWGFWAVEVVAVPTEARTVIGAAAVIACVFMVCRSVVILPDELSSGKPPVAPAAALGNEVRPKCTAS